MMDKIKHITKLICAKLKDFIVGNLSPHGNDGQNQAHNQAYLLVGEIP